MGIDFPEDTSARLLAEERPGDNAGALSVSEISAQLKRHVETGFSHVRIRGEISGYKRPASGHLYFALKDENAVIDGVMWKGGASRLAFIPSDGIEVIATGKLTTYPGRSKYQIVVETMEIAGEGALLALLEKLKARLSAEGLFNEDRKKTLPFLPRTIGVVTSPTGAVIRDILHRLADRCPTRVIVWPVLVQGNGAAVQIAGAVNGFSAMTGPDRPDLVIVARGGGSTEDLWAFNEEPVVRAVAACSIPIISAVGHETDTSLCDYAADYRAPTPTAAAERAVPVRAELLSHLQTIAARSSRVLQRYQERAGERLSFLTHRMPTPDTLLGPQRQRLDDAGDRMRRGLGGAATRAQGRLARVAGGLRPAILTQQWASAQSRLEQLWRVATTLNPDAILGRGYARVEARGGGLIATRGAAEKASAITLHFADGTIDARIENSSSETGSGKTGGAVEGKLKKAYQGPSLNQPDLF
jgi:exodeoxyribonuclease VII large subunit